jgi:hypothetical protein
MPNRNGRVNSWLIGVVVAGFIGWSGIVWYAAATAFRATEALHGENELLEARVMYLEQQIERLERRLDVRGS